MNEPLSFEGKDYFKFCHSEHVRFFTDNETIRISTPRHFRLMYAAMEVKDARINDPLDAGFQASGDLFIGPLDLERYAPFLRRMGIETYGAGFVNVTNSTFTNVSRDLYIFSAAYGVLEQLCAEFCRPYADPSVPPYDACFRIRDWRGFGDLIGSRAEVIHPVRAPLSALVMQLLECDVEYGPMVFSLKDLPNARDPFLKDPAFAGESEWRLVFRTHVDTQHDVLSLHVPGLREHLQLVDISEFVTRYKAMPREPVASSVLPFDFRSNV